jgi:hypothetical protein
MGTFNNGDSGSSIRTKLNTAIEKTEGTSAISTIDVDGGAIDGVTIGTNSAVTDLRVDNLQLDGNTVSSTNLNGDITIDPNGTGDVNIGNFKFDADQTVGAGQDNYVLTYDNAGGKISLEAAAGGGGGASELNDLSDAVGNATTDNYGAGRDVLGDITTGADNTAFGALAGEQITTGSFNSFYGSLAGRFVTTGSDNVGIGRGAASGTNLSKQTGDYNIGIGWNAGNAVVSTDKNTAVGYNADNTGNPAGSTAIGSDAVAAGDQATALTDSYASGTDSFAAAIGNNTSSYGATGANSVAMGYQAKATASGAMAFGDRNTASGEDAAVFGERNTGSGAWSFTAGRSNTNSGSRGVALGNSHTVSSFYTFASGSSNTASQNYATAVGSNSLADRQGKVAHASLGFGTDGDSQYGRMILSKATTDATATVLTALQASSAASNNMPVIPSGGAQAFNGLVVAKQTSSANAAAWEIKGLIANNGGTTTLIASSVTAIDNTPSWGGPALSADDANDWLAITCTGAASTSIRWSCTLNTSEVIYA